MGRPPDEARQHLEDALSRTRRISQPFIEVGCLAHLAIAGPLTGQPLPLALELSEQALAIAEEHGWTSQSMTAGGFVMAAWRSCGWGALPTPSSTSIAWRKCCATEPTRGPR